MNLLTGTHNTYDCDNAEKCRTINIVISGYHIECHDWDHAHAVLDEAAYIERRYACDGAARIAAEIEAWMESRCPTREYLHTKVAKWPK